MKLVDSKIFTMNMFGKPWPWKFRPSKLTTYMVYSTGHRYLNYYDLSWCEESVFRIYCACCLPDLGNEMVNVANVNNGTCIGVSLEIKLKSAYYCSGWSKSNLHSWSSDYTLYWFTCNIRCIFTLVKPHYVHA